MTTKTDSDIKHVGFTTFWFQRYADGRPTERRKYQTKSHTPTHTRLVKDYDGRTERETFSPSMYKDTGGMMGTFLEEVEKADTFDAMNKAYNQRVQAERKAARAAKLERV